MVDYAIFVLDSTGHVLSWNPGAERLKGYVADEIIGQHFSAFYTAEDRATEKPASMLRAAEQRGHVEDEGWRVRKDGSRFWASVVITRLTNEEGELVGFAKVTRDLTARREGEEAARREAAAHAARAEAERIAGELAGLNHLLREQSAELEQQQEEAQALAEELENSNETLQETAAEAERARSEAERARQEAEGANLAKAEFLRTMSHELRTPLNAIEGYLQLLQLGVPDAPTPSQLGYLARIQAAERNLLTLVNNVLSLERIEAGHTDTRLEPVGVRELWDAVEPLVTPQMRVKGLGYEVGPCDPRIIVRADRAKAVQVLLNLVTNAIKFTPISGRITLETEVRADTVLLHVRDTGVGIAADKLEEIFDAFAQSDSRLPLTQGGGVGLGLSISRRLAGQMGGEVTARSQIGSGSTFTLTLPRWT